MRNDNAQPYDHENSGRGDQPANNPARDRMDLQDSAHDRARLQPEETTIDLPDVKDIPGQEFVHVAPLGELADTTASSADEEGEGLFSDDEDDETEIVMGTEADVTASERGMLERDQEFMPTRDEASLRQASLDHTDLEDEELNEGSFGELLSATDLDTGDRSDETRTEAMGQGDEENKNYSLGSDDNDANENRSDNL
ncbi:MAG: hypothetical protein JWP27_298 [Flaviaesturariibacter sp.]|nr:hypothetical protein [Flaviaesturariibacter sp.]